MTLTAFNNHAMTALPYGRMALVDTAAWSAAPQASGASALNVTWFADTPLVFANGSFQSAPLQLRMTLSGTWAACKLTVKSMTKGDEDIDVAAMFAGAKTTTKTFLKPDIQAVISDKAPGMTAKIDFDWVFVGGAKPAAAGAKAADLAGVGLTSPSIAARSWGRIGQPGDAVAIELETGAVVTVGTALILLDNGKARERKVTDLTGVDIGDCNRTPIMKGMQRLAPFTFAPTDIV